MLEYLTVEDVAARLTVPTEMVRFWLRAKELRGIPLGSAGFRITEDDFQAFIRHRREDTSQSLEHETQKSTSTMTFLSPILQQRLIESSPDCIKVLDLQGQLLYMNPGGQQTMEIEDFAQCQSLLWPDLWHNTEKHKAHEAIAIARSGGVGTFQGFTPTMKGTPKWWDVTVTPIFNIDGSIQHLVAVSRDVSELKQAEIEQEQAQQALQESQQRLELAQQAAHIGTFEWDIPQNIVIWTPELEALYGLPPGGFEGKYENWVVRIHPEDRTRIEENLQSAIYKGLVYNIEFRVIWPDGSLHWLLGKGKVYYGDQQKPLYMIGINMDISERKELEQRKDEFISMASHELRTPITTIKASLQLAERRVKKLQGNTQEYSLETNSALSDLSTLLSRALRQVGVQNRRINDLLDASRIQADKLTLSLQPCNLAHVVREVVKEQQQIAPTRTIVLEILEPDPILVLADADRIGQVVSNYMTNALKYSPEAEPIIVSLRSEGQQARVSVRDHGQGLSVEVQQHIWERFYQVPGSDEARSSRVTGLGLGLYICQTLVLRHGGAVGVESEKGVGSTFWFTLPLIKET